MFLGHNFIIIYGYVEFHVEALLAPRRIFAHIWRKESGILDIMHSPVSLEPGRQKQEDYYKLAISLGYISRSCVKQTKQNKTRQRLDLFLELGGLKRCPRG